MHIKVKLKDILPNPFRDIKHYQIRRDKVENLKRSYRSTGIWPVIIVRKSEYHPGKYDAAFAHHRIAAGKEEYGESFEIEVILMDLSDEQMLKFMANENQQDFDSSFFIEMETVQAVVRAFADGKIGLRPPQQHGAVRCAPSFKPIDKAARAQCSDKLYSPITVAEFLGWTEKAGDGIRAHKRVEDAITALELKEEGYLDASQITDLGELSFKACERIINEANRERREKSIALKQSETYLERIEDDLSKVIGTSKEKEVAARVKFARNVVERNKAELRTEPAKAIKAVIDYEKSRKRRDAAEATEIAKWATNRILKELPDISQATDDVRAQIGRLLRSDIDEIGRRLEELTKHRQHLVEGSRRLLITELERLAGRAQSYANKFKLPEQRQIKETTRRLLPK